MDVIIYNSAGEEVRRLYSGSSQGQPGSFKTRGDVLQPGSSGIQLEFSGVLAGGSNALVWEGNNDTGQSVSGGSYLIKVQETDPFGRIVSWAHDVTVLPAAHPQSLNIYNSAGELVRSLDMSVLARGARIANFSMADAGKKAFVVPNDPSAVGSLMLTVTDVHGVQSQVPWDGRNSQGQPVASGIYNIQLLSKMDTGAVVIATRDIVVLKNPDSQSAVDVKVVPNPVGPKDRQVSFLFSPLPFGRHAQLMLYNLSGDLVAQGVSNAGADRLILNIGPWSSGIYLGVFEVREGGGLVSRRQLRVALRR